MTLCVVNPFVQSMAGNFEEALRLMEAALTDSPKTCGRRTCGRTKRHGPTPHGGLHGSAPWFLAVPRALSPSTTTSAAEFEPWEPPQPFDENTYASPNRMLTKAELLGYIDYCPGERAGRLTR